MDHLAIFKKMVKSRVFEIFVDSSFKEGLFSGTTHLSIGQEAAEVGLVEGLDKEDWIVTTHRCHTYNIARGSSIESMFLELFGSKYGLCKGLGGSMHMSDIEHYNFGSSAVVASGVPIATGLAFALKRQNKENISVAIFGDGATSRGSIHESMNISSVFKLPVLFYLENNFYGMSSAVEDMVSTAKLYKRSEGYSIESKRVNGNDILSVINAVKEAREYIIKEKRPYFIEAITYRQCGHSKSDKRIYRDRKEEKEWEEYDPIDTYASFLVQKRIATRNQLDSIFKEVNNEVNNALINVKEKSEKILSLNELKSLVYPSPSPLPSNNKENVSHTLTYREAINEALDEILKQDKRAFLIGEDIGLYGGCFGVTKGLKKKYKDQIFETPVSEEGFMGLSVGAAAIGEKPIVEVMYGDFSTLASDALINHASKLYFMSGGQIKVPLIYRCPSGGATGHGPQHSSSPESMFLNTPGLIVVAPSTPREAKGLLKSACYQNAPVIFIEHKALYDEVGEVGDENEYTPIGKCIITNPEKAILVLGYSRALSIAKKALKDKKSVTYLDLVTLKPLDEKTIKEETKKYNKIIILQDIPLPSSPAESVLRLIENKESKKIKVLTSEDTPIPFSRKLENEVLINEEKVIKALLELRK